MEATTMIILFFSMLFLSLTTSTAVDTISTTTTLVDGVVIESAGGVFQLGFFSISNSTDRFLGLWYKKTSSGTVLWVANRNNPINDTSGVLKINTQGALLLMDANNTTIWISNSLRSVTNPVAQLLNSGNFVVRDENNTNSDGYHWESFDHPGDTLLPGMKLGWDFVKGLGRNLTSWRNVDDPSPGQYTISISLDGYPQLVLRSGSVYKYRLGSWDGMRFNTNTSTQNKDLTDKFVVNDNEIYYNFGVWNRFIIMRMVLTSSGTLQVLTWNDQNGDWEIYFTSQNDACNNYALCGEYGSCHSTGCQCLRGFEPLNIEEWLVANWSDGCVRKDQLRCDNSSDGFMTFTGIKLPDTQHALFYPNKVLVYCQTECLLNCSCMAYAYMDTKEGGTGCFLWFGGLIDIVVDESESLDLYVKVSASALGKSRRSILKKVGIPAGAVFLTAALLLGLFLIHVFKKRKEKLKTIQISDATNQNEEDVDLPLFEFTAIANATNNFSISNKLGQGGFGPVYKGILEEGKEIAVKRLSRNSKQGLCEFKNEISCIAKLQHRNLVRLLGCCIKEGEMLLVYEYMPNRSLDSIIFDKELSKMLDWPKRYNIVKGIARGLLYLHHDSRLRIIHRDLKVSNILLDHEMNPKISDFGLARSFGGSEIEVNTTRVAGTHGYMPPEYLIDGVFSIKSDVYSFGVVVLEIVSGAKIRDFCHSDGDLNLLGYAWKLYADGDCLELVDRAIVDSCSPSEVLRIIQIGLLCLQPFARDRPTMSSVLAMLSSDSELPQPQQPGFFTERQSRDPEDSTNKMNFPSANELTATYMTPR